MSRARRASRLGELRAHVRAGAENRPGTYRMLGPAGEVLYVGKSISVRGRLLSYFRTTRGEKGREILRHTHWIDWEYVPSEFAALLGELRLIKRCRPPFNVEHKGDRFHCFLKLTREPAARLLLVRRVADDDALYYGPFRGKARVSEAAKELSDLLQLRDCAASTPMRFADQIDLFTRDDAPLCIRGDLQRCLAPCAGRCTQREYSGRVELVRGFLDGDADRPLMLLEARMRAAAQRLQFEYAAELRDRAARLAELRQNLVALRGRIEELSFVYPVAGRDGDDRVYLIRRGCVRAELPAPRSTEEWEQLRAAARQLFAAPEPHGISIPPHQVPEILLVARWFRRRPEERTRVLAPDQVVERAPTRPASGRPASRDRR